LVNLAVRKRKPKFAPSQSIENLPRHDELESYIHEAFRRKRFIKVGFFQSDFLPKNIEKS